MGMDMTTAPLEFRPSYQEEINVLAAKWNSLDDGDPDEAECFTAALNIAEKLLKERNESGKTIAKLEKENAELRQWKHNTMKAHQANRECQKNG